jgi:hypothetical protein
MAGRLIPTAVLRKSHKAVRPLLRKAVGLDQFFAGIRDLRDGERALIVDQAIMLLEGFYAHLPLKRAMYAVDPLQRLRLLRHRLSQFKSDRRFHAEMTDIFTSLCDLHTNYILPVPFKDANAWLPFKVEAYFDRNRRKYLMTRVADWFTHPTFRKGVELLYWNGIPIARAVEIAGAQSGGSNAAARHAQGLLMLTARPLLVSPPPDEEWVILQYRTQRGRKHQIRIEWNVTALPPETAVKHRGVSVETDRVRQIRKFLFEPEIVQFERKIAAISAPLSVVKRTETIMPSIFRATPVQTPHGKFGYVRIKSFQVDNPDDLVLEFLRLIRLLPQRGLIIDVRDNGGGRSAAAERMLQLISSRQPIEPERLYFINTPLTLELCQVQKSNKDLGPSGLSPWIESIQRSIETGATYSASFPYTDPATCNAIGRQYPGPSIVITNALSYSATEFFAAGFQDHGGKILGVDRTTGGGGANVRTHQELRKLFQKSTQSPFKGLPKEAQLRVAFRRSVRVGPQTGNDVEDFGITPDYFHSMTRNDLLKGNMDLINYAASLLI